MRIGRLGAPHFPQLELLITVLIALVLILPAIASGTSASGDDPRRLAEQRKAFPQAERALKLGQQERFQALLAQLTDYPLYPYLIFADLRRSLPEVPAQDIESFLQTYADTPLAPRLRRAWLKSQYRQQRWAEVVRAYESTSDSAMRCRYLHALYQSGGKEAALSEVEELWLVGYSQPPACDPIFDIWRREGGLTHALAWERVRLAIGSGNAGLAGYLARFVPEQEQDLVALWRRVRSSPETVRRSALFTSDHPVVPEIVAYGVQRWARRAPGQAARSWQKLEDRHSFTDEQVAAVRRSIGLALASRDLDQAMDWLAAVDEQFADQRVRETRVLTALKGWRWQEAISWIDKLETENRQSERWQYWRARSLKQLGDQGPATAIFADLAGRRSYYGFMAADQADLRYRLNESPMGVSESEIDAVSWVPGIRRAREFYLLGRTVDARREWYHTTRKMEPEKLASAAVLAHRWGWHDRAILTVGRTGQLDDLSLRFPLAYQEPVIRQAEQHALEPAWVFAVMRQESAFSADARSPAGALGLMQLMPRTARQVARRLNRQIKHQRQLLDADTNIQLGSAYLRRLLNDLDEHEALATAAYNAGPHRVRSWLPKTGEIPSDLWIEAVPFTETRSYVKRVFAYTAIYEDRLGREPKRLGARLAPVPSSLNGQKQPGKG